MSSAKPSSGQKCQKAITTINFFRQNKFVAKAPPKIIAPKKETSPIFTLENYFLEMERRHTASNTQNGRRNISTAEPGSRKFYRDNNPQYDYEESNWGQCELAKRQLGPLKLSIGGPRRQICQQRPESRYNKESIYQPLENKEIRPRNWTRERGNKVRRGKVGNKFRKTAGEFIYEGY